MRFILITPYVLLTAEKASLSYKVEQIDLLLNISFLFFMTVNDKEFCFYFTKSIKRGIQVRLYDHFKLYVNNSKLGLFDSRTKNYVG